MTEIRSRQLNASTRISAVVACYLDAPSIPEMYRRLRDVFKLIGVDREIIFVNDGSPDDAAQILDALATADEALVIVHHSRNFGSQSAFTSGMRIATGDAVVLLDGDLQDPPELIAQFAQEWTRGSDVVYGQRMSREAGPLWRLAYKAFYRIFRASSYVAMPLDAGDFSLMDRKVVNALNALPETDRLIRGLRAWVGFRQVGVPYRRPARKHGRSTNSLLRNFGWARKAIISYSHAPLEMITLLAVLTGIAAFLGIFWQIGLRILQPDLVPAGLTTVIVLMLLFAAIQLLCLAIVGSYLAHIYDEMKRRPPYIVSSITRSKERKERAREEP